MKVNPPIAALSKLNLPRPLIDIINQLWLRTGGSDDAIEGLEIGELYEPGIESFNVEESFDDLQNDVPIESMDFSEALDDIYDEIQGAAVDPDQFRFQVITTTANFTTTQDQIVICNNTSAITITLNATPDDGERVYIKRRSGAVTVSGTIDGSSSLVIASKYDCPLLVYTDSSGEWSLI